MSDPKISILIVENDEIMSSYINLCLDDMGYNVVSIQTTGTGAINAASKFKPDIILMDVVLDGGIDGIEAGARINSKLDIPIVYSTTLSDEETLNRAKKTNIHGYIVKPFRPEELRSNIEIALNSKYKPKVDIEEIKIILNTTPFVGESISKDLGSLYKLILIEEEITEDSIKQYVNDSIDIVIIDRALYETESDFEKSLELINQLSQGNKPRLLFFLHKYNKEIIYKAIVMGAMGILGIKSRSWQLVPAIESVLNERIWIDKEIINDFFSDYPIISISEKIQDANLTKREAEILELLTKGLTNKEISESLSLSVKTVKNVLTKIYEKFQVKKREEVIYLYAKIK